MRLILPRTGKSFVRRSWRTGSASLTSEDIEGRDGFGKSLQRQFSHRLGVHKIFDGRMDAPRHENLPRPGFVAQSRREVCDRADRPVIKPPFEADLAEGRVSQRDADAKA